MKHPKLVEAQRGSSRNRLSLAILLMWKFWTTSSPFRLQSAQDYRVCSIISMAERCEREECDILYSLVDVAFASVFRNVS
jgi:hypothetical protein